MAQHDIIEQLEELEYAAANASRDGNTALADQLEMEIIALLESTNEED